MNQLNYLKIFDYQQDLFEINLNYYFTLKIHNLFDLNLDPKFMTNILRRHPNHTILLLYIKALYDVIRNRLYRIILYEKHNRNVTLFLNAFDNCPFLIFLFIS